MPRYFTRDQAEATLPLIEACVRQIVSTKEMLDEAERELRGTAERIAMLGGAVVEPEKLLSKRNRCQALAAGLKEYIQAIQQHGCILKDLNLGLVDFPTLLHGDEVYLCWKLGEPRIEFWHGIDEGFRGRKPIDEDFLAGHCGEG